MARVARPRTIWSDDDDAEFPDINALVARRKVQPQNNEPKARRILKETPRAKEPATTAKTVRRRKLAPLTDNLLMRAWTPDSAEADSENDGTSLEKDFFAPRRTRVELRTRNTKPTVVMPPSPSNDEEEYVSAQEEITIIEDVSMFDDTFHSCNSDDSEFLVDGDTEEENESVPAGSPPRRPRARPSFQGKDKKRPTGPVKNRLASQLSEFEGIEEENRQLATKRQASTQRGSTLKQKKGANAVGITKEGNKDLIDSMSKLLLDEKEGETEKAIMSTASDRETTPPNTPPRPRPGLMSPKKLPRIPITPHRPSSDLFWSQEFIDDWNDEHSPRKQLFPDAIAARQNSPTKASPEKKSKKTAGSKKLSEREAKKVFETTKRELAEQFLQELDAVITNSKLAELAASTGGIKTIWTNKLNTTAGRANWKRETIRTRQPDGTTVTRHKHHASIELAEKVIDDADRLRNVLAHEFCHLANFMVSGITTNPHGREFKAWAAQCSRAFADRGVQVTTKHSYDIDFKYVWACAECNTEFKRHSRSIDPARHRCGCCRGELRQIKPVPRGAGKKAGGGTGDGGEANNGGKVVSEYQAFMKEQMRLVKEENPKSPQKEIMKIVASRWAAKKETASATTPGEQVKEVEKGLEELAV
ncbi:SprT-like family-domain-containing protein [Corynascus novoguineensis]|uniref:SprT-like family-domain-containing protein n=1 Tax=Corynascus novoguineensis TaxID=1126955 RepID=A0AAN7HF09_9PEZI|nr:SprT-like family-domain-containing protein [Corynascus novoguineensis]